MGVDITFTLDHKLSDLSMESVSSRFRPIEAQLVAMARVWSCAVPLDRWRDAGQCHEGEPFYMGPAGFSMSFGPVAVQVHHMCRFRSFTHDVQRRELIRRFARSCCDVLGGDRVIYAPDEGAGEKIWSLVTEEGRRLAEIEAELLAQSPPAMSFEELAARFCPPWAQPAYYVDTFADISTAA